MTQQISRIFSIITLMLVTGACGLEPGTKKSEKSMASGAGANDGTSTSTSVDCNATTTPSPSPSTTSAEAALTVVKSQCLGCHSAGQKLPQLDTEAKAQSSQAAVQDSIAKNRMPPGSPLSAQMKTIVANWGTTALTFDLLQAPVPITYNQHVRPIFNTQCAYCHSSTGLTPKGPYLNTYAALKSKSSESISEMNKGSMPPSNKKASTSAADKTIVQQWITAGRLEGAVPVTPTAVTFTDHIKPLIDGNCVGCHKANGTPPNLTTEAAVGTSAAAILSDLEKKTMPPGGLMFSAEVETFRAWKLKRDQDALSGITPSPTSTPGASVDCTKK